MQLKTIKEKPESETSESFDIFEEHSKAKTSSSEEASSEDFDIFNSNPESVDSSVSAFSQKSCKQTN